MPASASVRSRNLSQLVRHVAMETHKPALVVWIDKHEQEYGQGLLNGFLAED